jgi:phage baseplate assembly protein W
MSTTTNLAFPYAFDASGHTAQSDPLAHIGEMIEQILFTSPGERVNRPTFGSGTWLSDLIRVQSVDVTAGEATLQVTVIYTVIESQQQHTQQFVYGASGT